ncbi:linker for activation of T-cells family member 1 isoform X3 [Rhea pennata]|uniref:linker for activation of T-cells family member 1 isoform X3 n=1 Tax=Rhea pennata TaxID=8795 RepID=UPI002E25F06E
MSKFPGAGGPQRWASALLWGLHPARVLTAPQLGRGWKPQQQQEPHSTRLRHPQSRRPRAPPGAGAPCRDPQAPSRLPREPRVPVLARSARGPASGCPDCPRRPHGRAMARGAALGPPPPRPHRAAGCPLRPLPRPLRPLSHSDQAAEGALSRAVPVHPAVPTSPSEPQGLLHPPRTGQRVPSYENEGEAGGHPRVAWPRAPSPAPPAAPESEDDYNNELYATGYVEVLPDGAAEPSPPQQPQARDSGSLVAPGEEYENVPDGHRQSLADSLEYVNIPDAGASPAPRYASESEEDAPDYENLQH